MSENKKIRVRFAPSPTGKAHIGGLRTALYNFLFAKKNDGDFLLRIEDTDRKRFVDGAMENLINSMNWAGLEYDEGVFWEDGKLSQKGDFGPYIQSQRGEIYKKYALELVKKGLAYYCFCEPERLEKVRLVQQENKQAPMYDRYCLNNLEPEKINEKIKEKCPVTIRLKVPKNEIIEFEDLVRGKVSFNTNNIDDQILLKSDGLPTYHLANVVDDHLMNITHILRAEEWLPSTPKHILLYRAFGWEEPKFAHLPQLLSVDKKKLSKRMGDVAIEDYIKKGYLKEALINFIALLGWNPGEGSTQEIFSLQELIEKFELTKVHKAGAVFDLKKLDWINSQYIKKLSEKELLEIAKPFLLDKDFFINADQNKKTNEYLVKVLSIEKQRLVKLADIGSENKFFFEDIFYEKNLLFWKDNSENQTIEALKNAIDVLGFIKKEDWNLNNLEKKLLDKAGEKRGDFLWPLRAALTGVQKSPSPFECAWVLGKDESMQRLLKAIEKLA